MGILNVTPDSFSDGGRLASVEAAVMAGVAMMAAGAWVVDVGGESTRPGALPVCEADELARVLPVVERLVAVGVRVSVDTRKAVVMRACLSAGAWGVNDVGALRGPGAVEAVADAGCPVVLMHMAGEPATMQDAPRYADVVSEVTGWLLARAEACMAAGIARERIWLDPGIGFGKTLEHNLALLRGLERLVATEFPVVLGASRKALIGRLAGEASVDRRLGGSLALALRASQAGCAMVRVHDVPETAQALAVWRAAGPLRPAGRGLG